MKLSTSQNELLNELGLLPNEIEYARNQKLKVIVGMSGGVDSSVVAALLKAQGYQVTGIFMKNWEEEDENGQCSAEVDYADVVSVCEALDNPYYSINFAQEYKERVFSRFVDEYKQGLTPNPDILCNREIKFKVFFDAAMKLGADYLATGHYCQIERTEKGSRLVKGADANKDQSYFLYTIKSHILDKVLFPVGSLLKPDVRRLAQSFDLATKKKKDSTGICFIGERNFREFLSQYVKSTQGDFVDLNGKFIAKHQGHPFYTIGQRKGLGIGGPGGPWFVVGKNIEDNQVIVATGDDHPALYASELIASELEWVNDIPEHGLKCKAKVRYRQEEQPCTLYRDGNSIKLVFDGPQRAITVKQSVVLYQNEICLGGGVIEEVGETLYQSMLNKNLVRNQSLNPDPCSL